MYTLVRRVLCSMLFVCFSAAAFSVDYGRTEGSFGVSPTGAATYTIPIWTPPGPNGLQPSLSLSYNSQGGNGLLGIGWNLNAATAIERCPRTKHQDGSDGAVELTLNDRFCIGGNRLRLFSGNYGVDGSVYFTEIADYSRITAYGVVGNGPAAFVVEGKNGLSYEYGNSTSSRVFPGVSPTISSTPHRWMLSKVYDRNGNKYVVGYTNLNGFAVPDVISWTPTSLGSASYRYEAKFNYSIRSSWDSYYGRVAGFDVENRNRLENIQIKSAGVVKRKYYLNYTSSAVTGRSTLTSAQECADDLAANCFLPITFTYQAGLGGLTAGAGTPPAGSSNNLKIGRYDFNRDGKDDILYWSGSTWYAAFGANSGFAGPYNTGITGSALVDRFLPNGRDGIATVVAGNLWIYRWDDTTASFVGHDTAIASAMPSIAVDYDGNGLADLVYSTSNSATLTFRRNNSSGSGNPSFETTTTTSTLSGQTWGAVFSYYGNGLQRADVNGDGRQDAYAVVLQPIYNPNPPYQQIGNTQYAAGLLGSDTGLTPQPPNTWVLGGNPVWPSLNFNGDQCTDRQIGSNIHVAQCSGIASTTVAIPAAPLLLLDWDGDGKTDVLVNNGTNFGVYKSTGAGFSSLISTSIPVGGTFFALDQDGDGLEDLIKLNGTGPVSYWTHTSLGSVPAYATNVPELLSSVTDGFGVNHSPSYVSNAWGHYENGVTTAAPLLAAPPRLVVAHVASSNGIGGTFYKTYNYVGARENGDRGGEFVGFQRVDETDSRNGFITRTYFEQLFPLAGMVSKKELMRADGLASIAREVFTNASTPLDSPTNQRHFVFTSGSVATQYEVGGAWDEALLRTVTTANLFETTGGTLYDQTITTTEPVSSANGVNPGGAWVSRTFLPVASLLNDATSWCLGRPQQIQQISSHNLTYGTQITRTSNISWSTSYCRPTQTVAEPGSGTLQVTTDLAYDGFGNVNQTTITGTGMTPRVTKFTYSDATHTSGQFLVAAENAESVANSRNQKTLYGWNQDLGLPSSATDPNNLVTTWQYDAFGRRVRENHPDTNYTTWVYVDCALYGLCGAYGKMFTFQTTRDSGNARVTGDLVHLLDAFNRPLNRYVPTLGNPDNFSYAVDHQYDAFGRLAQQSIPRMSKSTTVYWNSFNYDLVSRVNTISRPTSDSNLTPQITNIYYEGLTTRVVDPQNKQTTKVSNATGELVRSIDHDGYYQNFEYDAFGLVKRVQDSGSNILQTSTYNTRGMLTARTDLDMGPWSFTPNALGETISQTDAKGQPTSFAFDLLGRLTSRTEAEGTSTWTWGTSSAAKNIGNLASVSGPGYAESFTYDSLARPSNTSISADTSYQIDYTYNAKGFLNTVAYPGSTNGCRFTIQLGYSFEFLKTISNASNAGQCGSTGEVYWTANEGNGFGQIIRETLGNGLVTNRAYDAVTGWLKTIQTGAGGGAGVQNLAYQWDLVGNLQQRKDINQSNLTEDFFYDNLYRVTSSNLNGVQNSNATYNEMGNITSRWDSTANIGSYTYHNSKKHQVTSTSNGWSFGYDNNGNMTSGRGATVTWTSFNYPASITNGTDTSAFSYTPDRQYWQQTSNYTSGGSATTIYIGGLLEKVTTSAGTDYRHMIRAGGSTIIVTRKSTGVNSVNYVTSDHLGSSSAITDSAGGILVNSSFDAFGKRRGANWSGSPSAGDWTAIAGTTRRGYTEHSMLDNLNLTHMNGRVYDPVIGRFLSADPYITEPGNSQSFNRYSYVLNNPQSFTDPTGFRPDTGPSFPGWSFPWPELWSTCYSGGVYGGCQSEIHPESDDSDTSVGAGWSPKPDSTESWSGVCRWQDVVNNPVAQMGPPSDATASKHTPFETTLGELASALGWPTEKLRDGSLINPATGETMTVRDRQNAVAMTALSVAMPTSRGVGKAMPGVIDGVAAAKSTVQVTLNRAAGNAFRDELASTLSHAGREVSTEVYKRTPFGKRFMDIEVSQNGTVLGGIETKVGSSRYKPLQQLKDWWLTNIEGYPVNVARKP